ncbi:microtubule-associated protein tau-like isoform X1 [Corvus hawaiiensis]|uniref:microtubule-associated protein tau-like isoform X1 n=1 Tax=Corvus hawaiiensis TaxID=134902 RepID=UPI0020199174|nr:microtubule-associated protein tau-like isoform X1 [Corvus hawaiiensis]
MGAGKTRRPPGDRSGSDRAAQAPGHGVVAFAGAASLGREERDAPEPEHTLVPVQQSPGEARKGQQGGRRGAGGLCCLTRVRRGSRTAGREGTGLSQQPRSANPHCTHSPFPPTLGRQSPLCSAATAPTTLQRPCASPDPPKSSSGGWFLPNPVPRLPAGKESRVSTRTKERSAALQSPGSGGRWRVPAPSAPGGVKHLKIERDSGDSAQHPETQREQRQRRPRRCPGGPGGVAGLPPASAARHPAAHPWPGDTRGGPHCPRALVLNPSVPILLPRDPFFVPFGFVPAWSQRGWWVPMRGCTRVQGLPGPGPGRLWHTWTSHA